MSKIKQQTEFQGLGGYDVLVNDTLQSSFYFNITELGDTLTGGKNGFLIAGSKHLKQNTNVKVEILDGDGQVVYSEIADGRPEYYEGISKVISAWIYNDTPIGVGSISILGELETFVDSTGTARAIPTEWEGIYNVRWTKNIQINRLLPNETRVRFFRKPTIAVTEIIRTIRERDTYSNTQQGTLDGIAIDPDVGKDWYRFRGNTVYRLKLQSGSWDRIIEDNGSITVTGLNQSYSTTVKKILNSSTVLATTPYFVTSSNSPTSTAYEQSITNIVSGSYTASFTSESFSGPNIASSSLADITISNLETFAGDVHRIKLFRKIIGGDVNTDYTIIQDSIIEANELLRDNSKTGIDSRTGVFNTSSDISNYWTTSSVNLSANINNSTLFQSVHLSGSLYGSTGHAFYSNNQNTFVDGSEYQLKFSTIGSGSDAYMDVYMSGSSFNNSSGSVVFPDDGYGKLIGSISTEKTRVFVDFEDNFVPDQDGAGVVNFVVKGGQFYIGDISLIEFFESSFSPNEFNTVIENPSIITQQTYQFKAEFFDINSNKIPVDIISEKVKFVGNALLTSASIALDLANKIDIQGAAADITTYSGSIAAGSVGGWSVTSTNISTGTPVADNTYTAAGAITLGAGYIGANKFKIAASGAATFKGTLSAPDGNLGGWTVNALTLSTGIAVADNTYTAAGAITLGAGYIGAKEFKIASDGTATFKGTLSAAGGTFSGDISAAGGNFTGGIDATYINVTSGSIGGWVLDATTLVGGSTTLNSNGTITTSALSASGANLTSADITGVVTTGNITATGGTIGGWNLSTTTLTSNNVEISNAGKIRMGPSGGPTSSAVGQELAGVYMDGTGAFFVSDGGIGSAEGYMKFDASSSTFELQTATGALTFKSDGTVASPDYLIERSRLFGSGTDGDATLTTGTNQSTIASTYDSHNSTANLWLLIRDAYTDDLTINSSVTLDTNGYRLFVKGTLTNNGTIRNNGSSGGNGSGRATVGSAGAGGTGSTLNAGTSGVVGGAGGFGNDGDGAAGGGSGGSGGIILISARIIVNNGTIESTGGAGGNGANGVTSGA